MLSSLYHRMSEGRSAGTGSSHGSCPGAPARVKWVTVVVAAGEGHAEVNKEAVG